MVPDCPVSPMAILQQIGRMQCFFPVFLMLFRICAGGRINFLQLANREWGLGRIFPHEVLVKIWQIRLALFQFRDNQPHLVAPVAQMDVAYHLVAFVTHDALDALADNRRAQVPHVQRLGHVRPAIINHDGARARLPLHAQTLVFCHLLQEVGHELRL